MDWNCWDQSLGERQFSLTQVMMFQTIPDVRKMVESGSGSQRLKPTEESKKRTRQRAFGQDNPVLCNLGLHVGPKPLR